MPTAMRRIRQGTSGLRPPAPAALPAGEAAGSGPNLRNRFRPLAQARTSAVLAAMDYLGQLAVRARYHYTDEEAQVVLDALGGKLEELVEAFSRGTGNRPAFHWPDETLPSDDAGGDGA